MPTDISSLTDLAAAADVTPRTVRYYISQGLLPGPVGQGSAARYTPEHLHRLRAIRRLADAGLSLARIRDHLSRMGEEQVERLAQAADVDQTAPTETPGAPALAYIRGMLGSPVPPAPESRPFLARAANADRAANQPQARYEPNGPDEFPPPGAPPVRLPAPQPLMLPQSSPWAEPGADRSTWERIALTPDIELHVRRPLDRRTNRLLEQLLDTARRFLGGR